MSSDLYANGCLEKSSGGTKPDADTCVCSTGVVGFIKLSLQGALWFPEKPVFMLRLVYRLQLGLWEPSSACSDGDNPLLHVRARWPLTDRRDSRSMPEMRSMRKSRIFTSLTELTAEALTSLQQTALTAS